MSPIRNYAQAAGDPAVISTVASLLARRWDPAGEFSAPDGTREVEAHARALLGILGTGPNTAAAKGYLRRAEEAALGTARSTSAERHAIAEAIRLAMVDATVAGRRAGSGPPAS